MMCDTQFVYYLLHILCLFYMLALLALLLFYCFFSSLFFFNSNVYHFGFVQQMLHDKRCLSINNKHGNTDANMQFSIN